jgi:hypothetical protein
VNDWQEEWGTKLRPVYYQLEKMREKVEGQGGQWPQSLFMPPVKVTAKEQEATFTNMAVSGLFDQFEGEWVPCSRSHPPPGCSLACNTCGGSHKFSEECSPRKSCQAC